MTDTNEKNWSPAHKEARMAVRRLRQQAEVFSMAASENEFSQFTDKQLERFVDTVYQASKSLKNAATRLSNSESRHITNLRLLAKKDGDITRRRS